MGEKSCFASLLVIQPGASYGSALIEAASSALLLPSRRRVDGAEGEPSNNSDFHQSHRVMRPLFPQSGDRRILFPAKATIKRCLCIATELLGMNLPGASITPPISTPAIVSPRRPESAFLFWYWMLRVGTYGVPTPAASTCSGASSA